MSVIDVRGRKKQWNVMCFSSLICSVFLNPCHYHLHQQKRVKCWKMWLRLSFDVHCGRWRCLRYQRLQDKLFFFRKSMLWRFSGPSSGVLKAWLSGESRSQTSRNSRAMKLLTNHLNDSWTCLNLNRTSNFMYFPPQISCFWCSKYVTLLDLRRI